MLERNKSAMNVHPPQSANSHEALQGQETVGKSQEGGFNLTRTILQSILLVLILSMAIFVMNWMIANPPKKPTRSPFPKFLAVESLKVELKSHQPEFIAYGNVVAGRSIDLRSSVSGEIIKKSDNLRIGYKVAAGEELLQIDDFNYQGALREAQANLLQTKASVTETNASIASEKLKLETAREQFTIAENDLSRSLKLLKQGAATQKQVDDRRLVLSQRRSALQSSQSALEIALARLEGQQATLQRLEWGVEQAKRNLENTQLKAPFSGIIQQTSVDTGKLVNANEVVAKLYDDEQLEVKFTLTDEQFGRLQNASAGLLNRKIKVIWRIGQERIEYDATINRIGAEIVTNRGGVDVFASFEKPQGEFEIRPGTFVELIVPDAVFENVAKIPDTAIYDGNRVYVIEGDVLKSREIEIALFDGEYALVSQGLKADEKLLITRIAQVSDDLKVKEFNRAGTNDAQASQ